MAKQRVQVNVPQAGTILSPKAAPVDTYYTPNVPLPAQDNSLLQLAEGLRAFTPGASQLIDRLHTDKVEADSDAGAASVSRYENQAAFKKAVDEGQIPRAASPWFQKARRLQQQRLAAEEYTSALNTAYAASNLQNFDDPQALRDFAASFTSTYVKEKGIDQDEREFTQVFAPAAANAQSQLLSRHAQQRMAAIDVEVKENSEREVGLIISNDIDANGVVGPETAKRIHTMINDMYLNGLSGSDSNDIVARAVIRQAEERGDSSILKLLDQIPSGSGMVGQVGRVRDLRRAAESRINQATHERQAVMAKQAKMFEEEESKRLVSESYEALITDPGADIKGRLSALAAVDPGAADKVLAFRGAYIRSLDDRAETDAQAVADITYRVNEGDAKIQDLMDAFTRGDINQTTLKKLAEVLPRAQQMRTVLGSPLIKGMNDDIGRAVAGSDYGASPQAILRSTNAKVAFQSMMLDFKTKNPDADEGVLFERAKHFKKIILEEYAPNLNPSGQQVEITYEGALVRPPEDVDWTNVPLFKSVEELDKFANEYDTSKGTQGRYLELLDHWNIGDAKAFYNRQKSAIFRRQHAKEGKAKK